MKYILTLICTIGCMHFQAAAQQQHLIPTCTDTMIHAKLITLNNQLEANQHKLILTKSILVPNGGLQPITVNLEAGKTYQFNFIPNATAQQVSLQVIGPKKKVFGNKKAKDGTAPLNIQFTAPETGNYIMIVSQKIKSGLFSSNKVKEICGGVSILSK